MDREDKKETEGTEQEAEVIMSHYLSTLIVRILELHVHVSSYERWLICAEGM